MMPYNTVYIQVEHDPGPGSFWPGAEFKVEDVIQMLQNEAFNLGTVISIEEVRNKKLQYYGIVEPGRYEIFQGYKQDGTPRQKARRV